MNSRLASSWFLVTRAHTRRGLSLGKHFSNVLKYYRIAENRIDTFLFRIDKDERRKKKEENNIRLFTFPYYIFLMINSQKYLKILILFYLFCSE